MNDDNCFDLEWITNVDIVKYRNGEYNFHIPGILVIDKPKGSDMFSVKQLEVMGLKGLYKRVEKQPC